MSSGALQRNVRERTLPLALTVAIFLHIVAFITWPQYHPSVYKLREARIMRIEQVEEIEIPPTPAPVPPPSFPVAIVTDAAPGEEETIPPTLLSFRHLPPPPPPARVESKPFVAIDKPPRIIFSVKPTYPEIARQAEVEGRVIVIVTVDEHGNVVEASIGSSEANILNAAALEAAYQFKFEPAYQRDIPVRARVSLTFDFKLRN